MIRERERKKERESNIEQKEMLFNLKRNNHFNEKI